jgi:hypothetical protein
MYCVLYNPCLQRKNHHLYSASLCYKDQAVAEEMHGISSTTLCLYLRVPGLNINQDTSYPVMGFVWFPQIPPGKCQDST